MISFDYPPRAVLMLFLMPLLVLPATAEDSYAPYTDRTHPTNVYWGDTHVHTSMSSDDANFMGHNDYSPTVAYRFARGDIIKPRNGIEVRLRRPLDFLVIADHAEKLGVLVSLQTGDPEILEGKRGIELEEKYKAHRAKFDSSELATAFRDSMREIGGQLGDPYDHSVWKTVASNADAYNDPDTFTALIGYEWTSLGSVQGAFGNLHRVVVFKDDASTVTKIIPFSAYDSRNPEDLWQFLERYRELTGGDVMAIPHNANNSNGEMFALNTYDGSPLTSDWARTRSQWEPLFEVTQIKGDSESHPLLSPNDEFADFETWNSWAGFTMDPGDHMCCPDWNLDEFEERKKAEYARPALKRGLDQQARLGVNPFKFGMIGSTDSHTSLATADNDNFWGKYTKNAPSATRIFERFVDVWRLPMSWETAAAGYAAVWADENTREAIFEAMKRKEVYASTGPRITVRFFGGWAYSPEDASRPDLARIGYDKGVPMGGDLTKAPKGTSPSFLIRAVKDPDGANLDRVQVVKGWRGADGDLYEKVYNAALSDGRKVRRNGGAKSVGNTVDIQDASYINSIGDPELAVTWVDPDFNGEELAFYYVRVLEIPTPRWTAYDANFFGMEDVPEEIPMVTQERAYTSPIWYTP
jgi:hypothetical protein